MEEGGRRGVTMPITRVIVIVIPLPLHAWHGTDHRMQNNGSFV